MFIKDLVTITSQFQAVDDAPNLIFQAKVMRTYNFCKISDSTAQVEEFIKSILAIVLEFILP